MEKKPTEFVPPSARADVAEVLFVEQVGHVELELGRLEARQLEAPVQIEIDHGVARRDFVIEVGGEAIADLLGLQAEVQVVGHLEVHARGIGPLRRLHQLLAVERRD